MIRFRLVVAASLALIVLAGCAALTQPTLYLLPPPSAGTPVAAGLEQQVIALDTMLLPQHAEDTRIAVLGPDGAVRQSRLDLWADPLTRAGTAALAVALEGRTGAPVMVEPLPLEAAPTIRVAVVADRFIGAPGGTLEMTGEIRVSDLQRNGLAIHRRFAIAVPVAAAGIPGLAQAHSAAIAVLADEIATALAARFATQAQLSLPARAP